MGLGYWDRQGYFLKRWKRYLVSLTKRSLITSEWEKRIHPEDVEEVKSISQQMSQGDSALLWKRYRLIGKNGSLVWVRDRARIVSRDSEGKPLRMVGMYTDLTQRRMDEIKLQKLNKLLTLMFRANEFLVHAKDEHSLLKGLCDIVVEKRRVPRSG